MTDGGTDRETFAIPKLLSELKIFSLANENEYLFTNRCEDYATIHQACVREEIFHDRRQLTHPGDEFLLRTQHHGSLLIISGTFDIHRPSSNNHPLTWIMIVTSEWPLFLHGYSIDNER